MFDVLGYCYIGKRIWEHSKIMHIILYATDAIKLCHFYGFIELCTQFIPFLSVMAQISSLLLLKYPARDHISFTQFPPFIVYYHGLTR